MGYKHREVVEDPRVEGKGESEREGKKVADVEEKRKEKNRRRFRLGTMALWQMYKFQKSTSFLIRKLPFARWVRESAQVQWADLRFQALTLLTLQEVAEAYIINLFEDVNLHAFHTKSVTLMPKDNQLAHRIWEDMVKYLPN